jgi:hypothetical protein
VVGASGTSYSSTQLRVVVCPIRDVIWRHAPNAGLCNRGWQGLFSEGFGDGEKEKPKRVVNRMPAGGKRTDIVVKTEAVEHSGGRFGGKVSCKSFHRIRAMPASVGQHAGRLQRLGCMPCQHAVLLSATLTHRLLCGVFLFYRLQYGSGGGGSGGGAGGNGPGGSARSGMNVDGLHKMEPMSSSDDEGERSDDDVATLFPHTVAAALPVRLPLGDGGDGAGAGKSHHDVSNFPQPEPGKADFVFLQLPTLEPDVDAMRAESGKEPAEAPADGTQGPEEEEEVTGLAKALAGKQDGLIGTLRIRASGKAEIVIGNDVYVALSGAACDRREGLAPLLACTCGCGWVLVLGCGCLGERAGTKPTRPTHAPLACSPHACSSNRDRYTFQKGTAVDCVQHVTTIHPDDGNMVCAGSIPADQRYLVIRDLEKAMADLKVKAEGTDPNPDMEFG